MGTVDGTSGKRDGGGWSARDVIEQRAAGRAIEEIFSGFHPAPPRTRLEEIFTSETARQFVDRVASFANLVQEGDSHERVLQKLDAAIEEMEAVRDQLLDLFYQKVRPVELSYRLVNLFFQNAEVHDGIDRPPVEFFIVNADTRAITHDLDSTTLVAIDEFIQSRNDTLNFRQFVSSLVLPGYVPDRVRRRAEDIATRWGMLLIGDLKDERTFRHLSDQFREGGGAYEFLRRDEKRSASDVVVAGYVKLRDRYWFEQPGAGEAEADLYGPASLIFAGCIARTDRTPGAGLAQGPNGTVFGRLRGVERPRIEAGPAQLEQLAVKHHVVTIARHEGGELHFLGNSLLAEDPSGASITSYRVLRYLERRIEVYLRRVAGQRLTRDVVKEHVKDALEAFLEGERSRGTIYGFDLDVDMDEEKFAMGVLDITLDVLPAGPAETFHLRVEPPPPKKDRDSW